MKSKPNEEQPAPVPGRATQAGDAPPDRWAWVERTIWTERMLEALERGVKGGVWFSLVDKVYRLSTLAAAWERVRRNAGSAGADGQSVKAFEAKAEHHLNRLHDELREGTYRPAPVKRVWIEKPGSREKRPLGVPAVRDRVVQTALRLAIEPVFEREFAATSYGFRPGRGCKDALRRVVELLKQGHHWVVDADLKGYLETASYYTPFHERPPNRRDCWSNTLMRNPFRLPRQTWTAERSPRFTRCNTV